jgi:tetratricopeptide (TPR) repeat protein
MRPSPFPIAVLGIVLVATGCGANRSTSGASSHLIAASEAITAGDKDKALTELSASIDSSPSAWAYFERARIELEKGKEDEAKADCQKGLEFDPTYADLKWLSDELKKPAAKRFKGKFTKQPGLRHGKTS